MDNGAVEEHKQASEECLEQPDKFSNKYGVKMCTYLRR